MKSPKISTHSSDSELIGSNETPSWVSGRNCVYRDGTVAKYRVAIRTTSGWKSYGHFNDLETAAYVANIAILAELCEEKYELNEIGEKNKEELNSWRQQPGNLSLEKTAGERYKDIQTDLSASREQDRIEAEKATAKRERPAAVRKIIWDYYSTHRTELPANISEQRNLIFQLLMEGATPDEAFTQATKVRAKNSFKPKPLRG